MNEELKKLYDTDTKKNNTLIELNTEQYKRLKEYSIHLSKIKVDTDNNLILYGKTRYGKNVSTTKQSLRYSGNKKSRWINMKKSSRNMVLFLADKNECINTFKNIFVVGTVMTYNHKKKKEEVNHNPQMSGIVVLMMAVLRHNAHETTWIKNIHAMARGCKTNSLSSYSHHGTQGFVYSFGNKPLYGNNAGSSVSTYVNKRSKVEAKNIQISQDAKYLEMISAKALEYGISKISEVFPEIKHVLSPIINAAFDKQCEEGLELLDNIHASDNGCWNSFIFVNGRTHKFHRENDCAYTCITVPKQFINKGEHVKQRPAFIFKIDEEQELSIEMSDDLSFFYNASFLTHRQSYTHADEKGIDADTFFNVSSYANEKLFNHLRQSFNRLS